MALQHQLNQMAMGSLEMEISRAIAKLKSVSVELDKPEVRERVLRPAAEILQKAAQAKAPRASKVVNRYSTSKFSKRIRAPRGKGHIVASYEPGNLKLAMQILKFKRSKALFVGAKVMKRNPNGTFGKGKRADGWYAHFIEFGTKHSAPSPFMRPAAMSSAKAVRLRIKYGLELELKRWMIKNVK